MAGNKTKSSKKNSMRILKDQSDLGGNVGSK